MNDVALWRPFAAENVFDPYPMYQKLREKDPVHLAQTREVIISRYEDVRTILKSNVFETGNRLEWLKRGIEYLQKKEEDLTAINTAINSFILMLNPPQHTRIRNFVASAWNDKDVDAIIKKSISKTLSLVAESQFDAIIEYAQPLSVFTICEILGIDGTQHRYLKDLGLQMSRAVDLYPSLKDLVQINQAAQAFIKFFAVHVAEKKANPDQALLSKLIQKNHEENIGLQQQELISIAIFLFIAGQETSSALIGNGVNLLMRHPEELEKLRGNWPLVNQAVEEILRYDSPVQLLGRIASEEVSLGDKIVHKGASVTLVVGSANRDGSIFEQPDRFNIERKPNRHLSFGSGIHFCLGDWLARRQAQLAIEAFFTEFKNISMISDQPKWNKNLAIRSLQSLPVSIHQR
jgi:pimeloyl-[acyl-carrier protein] synthase